MTQAIGLAVGPAINRGTWRIAMNTHRKAPRSLTLARALLGGMLLVSVVLICLANFMPKPADSADVKTALDEAARDRAARDIALKEARKAVPKDAPIPPDWEFSKILDALEGNAGRVVVELARSYADNPDDISDTALESLRNLLDDDGGVQPGNPFFFPLDLKRQPKQEILSGFRTFLTNLKALREVEAGLGLGLCLGVVNDYSDPFESNIGNLCVLFAGRALCEVQAGQPDRAMETCLAGYRIARLLEEWPHYYSYYARFFPDRSIDLALFRVVDAGPVNEQDQARLLETLDSRKRTDGLAKALRLGAAYLEAGLKGKRQGYPSISVYWYGFEGRGSMERAKRMLALLDRPPYAVKKELAQIEDHVPAGYWTNRLAENCVISYRLHAREALVGDIARIAFALKAHALKQGAYPASLQELNPPPVEEIPKDPLTGNPVVYQDGGNGFTLSSLSSGDSGGETYWIARK